MPLTEPFDRQPDRYEDWFDHHGAAYRSELRALDRFVNSGAVGLEIGVGSGRFAAPLGIGVGVDPSPAMLRRARDRGIEVVRGTAEDLPVAANSIDVALLVTAICFVSDLDATFAEAARVLREDGRLVLGYVDRESDIGREYQASKDENPFYRDATFYATDEVLNRLDAMGFRDVDVAQTIFHSLGEVRSIEPVREGSGEGSFVALSARPPR
ncbi:MAG: class I SAM-dependent methyltransferase [Halanaeroarchaeum sp.]